MTWIQKSGIACTRQRSVQHRPTSWRGDLPLNPITERRAPAPNTPCCMSLIIVGFELTMHLEEC